jgi:hypothetical protein
VRYELGFYIPEDGILDSPRGEILKSYIALTDWVPQRRHHVSPVRYELGCYIPKYDILHSYGCENLKFYNFFQVLGFGICQRITKILDVIKWKVYCLLSTYNSKKETDI